MSIERESMSFDVLVVGGGPAGLAAAIRIKQRAQAASRDLSVCLIEKGAEIGAHILSGAIMDPRGLDELLPDWHADATFPHTPVTAERFMFLGEKRTLTVPHALLPAALRNAGCHILSLGQLCRWLGTQAEALGVDIFAGFSGAGLSFDDAGRVNGVITGDMGVMRDGTPGPQFQPGIILNARYTLFAEGCRGHLGKQLEGRFDLRAGRDPQTYGLGIKELWEVPDAIHQKGLVVHTAGWPLDAQTYGGGFAYHYGDNRVAVGLVVGLGYTNPYLSPFEEFQRFKTHAAIRTHLEGGKRIGYGARALTAGGVQSLPKLVFPGGALIGDDAGFLNAARIKGTHTAIKSGMLAADAAFDAVMADRAQDELTAYLAAYKTSWLHEELHRARNFKPSMRRGLWLGSLLFGFDQHVLRGKAPWTWHHRADHDSLKPAAASPSIAYPKPDGLVSFDRLSSVYLSGTHHEENQPCHLKLTNAAIPISVNLAHYDAPEQRYCPAGVYEIVHDTVTQLPALQINAQNCVHCKTCDIKDPTQNIEWVSPQGGDGPLYPEM